MIRYNLYYRSLRDFPGPPEAPATSTPFFIFLITGKMIQWTLMPHELYGDVVLHSSDHLSDTTFTQADHSFQNPNLVHWSPLMACDQLPRLP